MEEIRIVDTTLRDGNTSLWAHNMTTGMMHPVLKHMDQAGFEAMEFFVAGRFKKVIREQLDNPWDWVRYGQKEIEHTQLRYHGGLTGGFILSPLCIPRLLLKLVIGYGINQTRLSDPWNDYSELKGEVEELKQMGMTSVVNLIYSISPRHTDEYWTRKVREAAAMKPYRLCFKDVAGMLTPDRAYSLAKLILANIGDVPVEFHSHCNNGLAPFNVLEVVKAGIRIVHTSIPPLANGSAQPSVFNVVNNLRALGYKPMINEKVLPPVEAHFRRCAAAAGLPIGAPREYDQGWYRHQVPGGMISNLRHQLKMLGKEDKMPEVLEEIVQVRAELGYPIMVTPFAQFVGSQAAINIMTGERYKEVTDQVIQFAMGLWGKEGAQYMDKEVKAKILNRKRAKEMENFEIPNTPLEEVRAQYGGPSVSDEELIMRYYAGPEFVDALKNAPPRKEYLDARQPLVKLVEDIANKPGPASVYIRRNEFTLAATRRAAN